MVIILFKQKQAYLIRLSLVGSEMCIRDRIHNNIKMLAVIFVLVSVLPVTFEYLRGRSKAKGEAAE